MYRRNLPHIEKADAAYFITFRTWEGFELEPPARDLVMQSILLDNKHLYRLHATVVMPNHVHLLLTPLRDKNGGCFTLARIMNRVKGASAHSINKLLKRNGSVWQDESFDRVIRSSDDLEEKVLYLIANPIRAGLAEGPHDYRWQWRE
jgi:REP element-mobilizing transposase RayT